MDMASHDAYHRTSSLFRVGVFLTLIVIALWSSYQLIIATPRLFGGSTIIVSNIFSDNTPTLVFALADTTLVSGTPRTLTWEAQHVSDAGIFSFAYACNGGLTLTVEHTDDDGDTQFRTLPCNTPYSLPTETRSLAIVPFSPTKRFVDTAFSITFIPKDGERLQDIAHVIAVNDENTNAASVAARTDSTPIHTEELTYGPAHDTHTPTPAHTATTKRIIQLQSQPHEEMSSTPDLSVSIIKTSGGEPAQAGNGYALFRVHNKGTSESGTWTFLTERTTPGEDAFLSAKQESIPAGGYTDVGVTFAPIQSVSTFVITIDPHNTVAELNEKDNTVSTLIHGYEL